MAVSKKRSPYVRIENRAFQQVYDDLNDVIDNVNQYISIYKGDVPRVKGDLIPDIDGERDLGDETNRFKDLYLKGDTIYLGDLKLTKSGTGSSAKLSIEAIESDENANALEVSAHNIATGLEATTIGTSSGTLTIEQTGAGEGDWSDIDLKVPTGRKVEFFVDGTGVGSIDSGGFKDSSGSAIVAGVPLAGDVTITGDIHMDDDVKIEFGDGDEYIKGDGTDLIISSTSNVSFNNSRLKDIARITFNNGGSTVDIIRDEDDMASDDPMGLATQQSIKAYVDTVPSDIYSRTLIKVMPNEFLHNDDRGVRSVEDDTSNTLGIRSGHLTQEQYAFVKIPNGYKATHCQVFGSASTSNAVTCKTFNYTTGATTDLETFDLGTNQDITDVTASTTNDLVIKLTLASTSTIIYGASVTIEKV